MLNLTPTPYEPIISALTITTCFKVINVKTDFKIEGFHMFQLQITTTFKQAGFFLI